MTSSAQETLRARIEAMLREGTTQRGTPLNDHGREVLRDVLALLDRDVKETPPKIGESLGLSGNILCVPKEKSR